MTTEQARKVLELAGYQTYNLWNVEDVMGKYDCSEEQAMKVLESALENDAVMEAIWYAIDFHAKENNLKSKE